MTSKEVLKEMCDYCRKCINQIPSNGDRPYKECPYRGISGDYCENYEIIKKDLEILEIIKKWSFIQEGYKVGYGPYTQFLCNIHTVGMEEDFYKVKEWLENGNN